MQITERKSVEMRTSNVRSRYFPGVGEVKSVVIHIGILRSASYKSVCRKLTEKIDALCDEGVFVKGKSACTVVNLPGEEMPLCITVEIDNILKLITAMECNTDDTMNDICFMFTDFVDKLVHEA